MPKYKKPTDTEKEFLEHSNYIEQERSEEAFEDSIKAWQYAVANADHLDVNYVLMIHHFLLPFYKYLMLKYLVLQYVQHK